MSDPRCVVTAYGLKRACGSPSTYNNARCRGEACTKAIAKSRADYRARQKQPIEGEIADPKED